ncbi:MAG TPA: hypothetical protein VF941_03640 [Clostridia bacterium]
MKSCYESDVQNRDIYYVSKPTLISNFVGLGIFDLLILFYGGLILIGGVFVDIIYSILISVIFVPIIFINLKHLNMPYKIIRIDENHLMFKAVINNKIVEIQDIKEFKKSWISSLINVRLTKGKLQMFSRIDGLYELLAVIKQLNPDFITKGL